MASNSDCNVEIIAVRKLALYGIIEHCRYNEKENYNEEIAVLLMIYSLFVSSNDPRDLPLHNYVSVVIDNNGNQSISRSRSVFSWMSLISLDAKGTVSYSKFEMILEI